MASGTEGEIDRILTELRQMEPILRQLYAIDVGGKPPFTRLDVKRKKS